MVAIGSRLKVVFDFMANEINQSEKKNTASSDGDVQREGWSSEELNEEASNHDADQTKRQISRGEEQNTDNKDIVGDVDFIETPKGKEESEVARENADKSKTQKTA